jgi:hypothetical protein
VGLERLVQRFPENNSGITGANLGDPIDPEWLPGTKIAVPKKKLKNSWLIFNGVLVI